MLAGALLVALAVDVVAGTSRAIAFWIAPLSHKARQNTMKREGIVKLLLDQADKIANRLRGLIFKELDDNYPFGRLQLHARQIVRLSLLLAYRLLSQPGLLLFGQRGEQSLTLFIELAGLRGGSEVFFSGFIIIGAESGSTGDGIQHRLVALVLIQ